MQTWARGAAVVLISLLMQACGSKSPTGTDLPGPEARALATALAQQGGDIRFAETMTAKAHPFFRVPASRYVLNGESLYVFEYESARQVAADADRIGADGASVGLTQISWVSDPHFYRSRQLIVLYVGKDASILDLLQRVVGRQIAGKQGAAHWP